MKLQVTEAGVHDAKGKRVPVGTILEVKGEVIPPWLINKARPVVEVERRRAKAEAKPAGFTREGIATIAEEGIDELLETHGVAADGASLADKRAALAKIMFPEG